jgi:hypothetical protein
VSVVAAGEVSSQAVIGLVIDALIERHGADAHAEAVAAARNDFERRRGRVYEDQELWETWTQAFLEWYVVERVPPGRDRPLAADDLAREEDPRRAAALRAWLTSYRSLMEVKALHDGRVEMEDILAGGAFSVAEKRRLHGVTVGHLAEVRLIGFEDDVYFGRTFCYHEGSAKAAILERAKEIYAAGGDRRDVLDACAAVRLRAESYRHVDPVRLYARAGTRG